MGPLGPPLPNPGPPACRSSPPALTPRHLLDRRALPSVPRQPSGRSVSFAGQSAAGTIRLGESLILVLVTTVDENEPEE